MTGQDGDQGSIDAAFEQVLSSMARRYPEEGKPERVELPVPAADHDRRVIVTVRVKKLDGGAWVHAELTRNDATVATLLADQHHPRSQKEHWMVYEGTISRGDHPTFVAKVVKQDDLAKTMQAEFRIVAITYRP